MVSYLINFSVYTLAMIGVILLGFVIVQKSLSGGFAQNRPGFMLLEQTLCIEPRKNIHLIKAGSERFLISTDAQGTSFLTKIAEDNSPAVFKTESTEKTCVIDLKKRYDTEKIVIGLFQKLSSYTAKVKVSNKR